MRFVVCGETLIDLVRASEVPADTFRSTWRALSAGGPMNSAVALGRLGADVQFLGRLSTDSFGAQLRGHIEEAGVGLDLATEASQPTSIAVVSFDERGSASYTFHFIDTANFSWQPEDLPVLDSSDWLHIASLVTAVPPGYEVLLDWAATCRTGLSYDINVRPSVIPEPEIYWGRVAPWLRLLGQHQGILKASDVDIAFLAKADGDGSDPVEVLGTWVERYGLRLGLVTVGADGAVAVEPDGTRTAVPVFPTTVVDTVGAGDTFMAGFLDGYIRREENVATALTRGVAAAAIVCSREGADPPTEPELDALLRTCS